MGIGQGIGAARKEWKIREEQMTDPMIYYTFEGRNVGFGHRTVGILQCGKRANRDTRRPQTNDVEWKSRQKTHRNGVRREKRR